VQCQTCDIKFVLGRDVEGFWVDVEAGKQPVPAVILPPRGTYGTFQGHDVKDQATLFRWIVGIGGATMVFLILRIVYLHFISQQLE
jgi:hypothetical protein